MSTETMKTEAETVVLDNLFNTDTVERKTDLKMIDALAYLHLISQITKSPWENGRSYDGLRHFLSTRDLRSVSDYENAMRVYFSSCDNWKEIVAEKERKREERKAKAEANAKKREEKMTELFGNLFA